MSDERHLAIAANGDDVAGQVEGLEEELRCVHGHLDRVLCAIESLMQSPALTPELRMTLLDALEPASRAISSGASRLCEQVRSTRTASGW